MDEALIRRVLEVNWRNLALGHQMYEAEGATFVRNFALPAIHDANFVFGVTSSSSADIERLKRRASEDYQHAARITYRVGPFTPPGFEESLATEGYERRDAMVLLLDGPFRGRAGRFDIRRISNDDGWRDYSRLKHDDWFEYANTTERNPDASIAEGFVAANRLKCPPVEYFLAHEDGQAVGHCSTWEGLHGIGQVEDLFVHPAHRRHGIATALLSHCVQMARERGAGPIVIVVDAENSAKDLYAALGWLPLTTCREYGKNEKLAAAS